MPASRVSLAKLVAVKLFSTACHLGPYDHKFESFCTNGIVSSILLSPLNQATVHEFKIFYEFENHPDCRMPWTSQLP